MRITKKQLLGLSGLAFVAGMTMVACSLPSSAYAAEDYSVDGNVDVYVYVYSDNFETKIQSPLDGEVFTNSEVHFSEIHSKAKNVKYYLTHVGEDGEPDTVYELTEYEVEGYSVDGVTEFDLNLNNYGGWGTYIFKSVITSGSGKTGEDSVKFNYAAINIPEEEVPAENGEVKFTIDYAPTVKIVDFDIYDKDGKLVAQVPGYVLNNPTTGGSQNVTLNIDELGIPSGSYTIVATGYDTYDRSGGAVGTDSVKFSYSTPDAPNVPDTGSLLGALNIAKGDFLVTGLIGFTVISVIALIVIKRANRKE